MDSETLRPLGMGPLFTPWRLKWYPRLLLLAVTIGVLIALVSGEGASTALQGRLGGDYPAFYGAGKIIAEGDGQNLYNAERQARSQQGLFPDDQQTFIPFPYPPHVALLYTPLSLLNYRFSFAIHILLMVCAVLLALWAITPMCKAVSRQFFLAFTLLILYYPLFRAIIGGSNTPITLLLIALCWRSIEDGYTFRAGFLLGLLLFKPQYALPLIGLFILSGRFRVVIGSIVTGFLLWGIGVSVAGWDWFVKWFGYAHWVVRTAADIDKQNAISWIGFLEALWCTDSTLATVLGYSLVAATIAVTCWAWWKSAKNGDLTAQLGLAAACIVLIPSHVFYYDAGFLAFTWIALINQEWSFKTNFFTVAWLWGFTQPFATWLGFSPIFLFTACTFFLAVWKLSSVARDASDSAMPDRDH